MSKKLILVICCVLIARPAFAVRPFVTDDARIVDKGQIEFETWFATNRYANGRWGPPLDYNIIIGNTVNEWLEILMGSGVGVDNDGRSFITNPVFVSKFLLKKAEPNSIMPGVAFSFASVVNAGFGPLKEDGVVNSLVLMTTNRILNDKIFLHLNLGTKFDHFAGVNLIRPYWGAGLDFATFIPKTRYIIEAFAGDPYELNSPKYAFQTGFRYLKSDTLSFDFTVGMQPEYDPYHPTDGMEMWFQFGIRWLIDRFRPGGEPGDPDGAKGLFHKRKK
jgi:hypothetical protein